MKLSDRFLNKTRKASLKQAGQAKCKCRETCMRKMSHGDIKSARRCYWGKSTCERRQWLYEQFRSSDEFLRFMVLSTPDRKESATARACYLLLAFKTPDELAGIPCWKEDTHLKCVGRPDCHCQGCVTKQREINKLEHKVKDLEHKLISR